HMNGIGGDAFWLLSAPGAPVRAIDASGAAGRSVSRALYADHGLDTIPMRGPLASNTVAGTISGWNKALEIGAEWGGRLPLSRLLGDAIHYARDGIPVTASQAASTQAKLAELATQPGFAETFLIDGASPQAGSVFLQPRLAEVLEQLVRAGLDDYYRGDLARRIAGDLATIGSPLTLEDLNAHRALEVRPLALRHSLGTVYNMTPPTQGVISLAILGVADRLGLDKLDPLSADYVHLTVEATNQAFRVRDRHVTDPAYMKVEA